MIAEPVNQLAAYFRLRKVKRPFPVASSAVKSLNTFLITLTALAACNIVVRWKHQGNLMAYTAEISRDHPTCFLFIIDQSGSMEERMGLGRSKADFVADVLNKTLYTVVTNCTKADGIRPYFDIGVIAYGGA